MVRSCIVSRANITVKKQDRWDHEKDSPGLCCYLPKVSKCDVASHVVFGLIGAEPSIM